VVSLSVDGKDVAQTALIEVQPALSFPSQRCGCNSGVFLRSVPINAEILSHGVG
jgi:hypothetical protein